MTSVTTSLFEYRKKDDSITILGCRQQTAKVYIPERLEGMAVTEISEKAFTDAGWLQEIRFPDSLSVIGAYAFRECRGMTKLILPDRIERIGSHAFYNCRNLESITMVSTLRQIEDGAFKNCTNIREVILKVRESQLISLPHIFDELQQQVMVHLMDPAGVKVSLFFPRDLVLYSEYTSRLYNPVAYGVGHQYRQTVTDGQIDYVRYDTLFAGAQNELTQEQLGWITISRLMTPKELSEESRVHYEAYARHNCRMLMEDAMEAEDYDRIQFILDQRWLTEEDGNQCYEYARQKNQVETGSRILQYLGKSFSKQEDEFEL